MQIDNAKQWNNIEMIAIEEYKYIKISISKTNYCLLESNVLKWGQILLVDSETYNTKMHN